jgi:hypothetical protein
MRTINFDPSRSQQGFCAIEYVPEPTGVLLTTAKNVISLAVRDAKYVLRFFVHPNLHKIVWAIDLPHIKSLLEDFIERVRRDAENLFRQLCSLSAGILVTRAVGENISYFPKIQELVLQFVPV